MKKIILILVPIILICSILGLILFTYLKNSANTPEEPTNNSNTEYQETIDSTEPIQTDSIKDNTQPTEDETKSPEETTQTSTTTEQEPDSTTDSSDPTIQDPTEPSKDESGFIEPEEVIMKVGDIGLKITGDSNATDIFDQLNMQYVMVPSTEGLIKVNSYRSLAHDGIGFGAINTMEFNIENEPHFCGVSMRFQDTENESLSILGVSGTTTLDELVAMYGEPKEIEYGGLAMHTNTIYIGDDTILLITQIDQETGCVKMATATFW